MVNIIAVAVLTTFWTVDYGRELSAHLAVETGRLREEARVLRVARRRAVDPQEFQAFLDEFCEQMGVAASPGHHIAIFDERGMVTARAHERADPALEAKMAALTASEGRFRFQGEDYLAVRTPVGDTGRIVITQSLRPIHDIIAAESISRAASLALLGVLIFGGTTLFVLRFVRDPLDRLVGGVRAIKQRKFGTRVQIRSNTELRYLANGVNEMAEALERVERERFAQMQRAHEIQRRLLPNRAQAGPRLSVAAEFEPADSVAGDLYDVVLLDDGSVLVTVLDVSGHGIAASLYTALLRAVLRGEARRTSDPGAILQSMNEELAHVVGRSGEFVTCFLARIDAHRGEVRYAGAGHEPVVLLRADGDTELLEGDGLPLGVMAEETYGSAMRALSSGDRLLLFTDGLHEVAGPDGTLFGRSRLVESIRCHRKQSAERQVTAVVTDVRRYASGRPFGDDFTLMCVELLAESD